MVRWLKRLFSGLAAPRVPPARSPVSSHSAVPDGDTGTVSDDAGSALADPTAPVPHPPVSFEQLDRINGAWNGWLFDRLGQDGLDLNDTEVRVLEALAAILSSQQSGAALVRRMPGLVPQLLQSLRSERFSGSALSRTISSDVVLVAAVIRLANNCQQGTGNTVTSVEHAVILIGHDGRNEVAMLAMRLHAPGRLVAEAVPEQAG